MKLKGYMNNGYKDGGNDHLHNGKIVGIMGQ